MKFENDGHVTNSANKSSQQDWKLTAYELFLMSSYGVKHIYIYGVWQYAVKF